jgi:predicted alpha/beta superfamily hydrolase
MAASPSFAKAEDFGRIDAMFVVGGEGIPPRQVQIWTPPGYDRAEHALPVVYMHDGQNLLAQDPRPVGPFGRWNVDRVLAALVVRRIVPPAIVVAIDNGPNRAGEYLPKDAFDIAAARGVRIATSAGRPVSSADVVSDAYLRMIVEVVKPRIDRTYRTDPRPDATCLTGSSMGGLISLYGLCRHPEVFGQAACLSTHWIIGDGAMIDYMRDELPDPATHRLYFDRGTEDLDAQYAPFQPLADQAARQAGYRDGLSFETSVFPGATHNEVSWSKRLDVPFRFLLASS